MEPDKAAVRAIKGPKICGDGLDIHGDTLLSASFSTENALQVSTLLIGTNYRPGWLIMILQSI